MTNIKVAILSLASVILFGGCGSNYDELLRGIPEYMKLTKTIKAQETFKGFDPMSAWRLLIDGNNQSGGPMVFDKEEPGYLAGLARGLDFALEKASKPLTVEFIEEIRFETVAQVKKTNESSFVREIGGNAAQFNLVIGSNASEQGMKDLKASLIGDPLRKVDTNENGTPFLYRGSIDRDKLYPQMKKIIDNYESSNKSVKDIIVLSQLLDQLHPFNDGNVRTFVIIIFQKELARSGFPPLIFSNPNMFDAFSVPELEKIVADGQKDFAKRFITPFTYHHTSMN